MKLLEALAEGRLQPKDIKPVKSYVFIETDDRPGYYDCNGKTFNPEQFKAFVDAVDQMNTRRESIGLMTDGLFIIKSSKPIEKTQRPVEPIPEPIPEPIEVTEDIPAIIETGNTESEAIKPKIIKPKTFNLKGEEVDRQRSEKMNQFKKINNNDYE